MFKSARAIQDWFTNCAYIISSILGEPVEWVTPLGFPIVQPYYNYRKSKNQTDKLKLVHGVGLISTRKLIYESYTFLMDFSFSCFFFNLQ